MAAVIMRQSFRQRAYFLFTGVLLVAGVTGSMAQREVDPLTLARRAYNLRQYDQAVTLAMEARQQPALSNSAALVLSRALLARFRMVGDVADVATARQALLSVDPSQLMRGESAELQLGTGELLFVDDQFGAAAEMFEWSLDRPGTVPADQRDRVLEWWAASLDRYAQLAPDGERQVRYRRLLTRLDREGGSGPTSAVALYWLAAAARGVDDPERAWSLVIAAWVQAPVFAEPVGLTLRADLDRLMREAIIPDRARRAAPDADPVALKVALAAEWESLKERWK
jgi:hypothetical protein